MSKNILNMNSSKSVPTEALSSEEQKNVVCAGFRGKTDIGLLRKQLLSLENECWDEEYNQVNNVSIQRPFHDKLGVNKIICIFSDTALNEVFYLPAWERWKSSIIPIIEASRACSSRVVRLLFARLPPRTAIPAHHDNGTWVSKTHRIHVPIYTNADVEFKSGPTVESMKRFAFNEGDILELNNAAKHSVYNGSNLPRIHLIFDFIENDLLKPTRMLTPGQKCRQIRGRIQIVNANDLQEHTSAEKRSAEKKLQQLLALVECENDRLRMKVACRHFFIEQIDAHQFSVILRSVYDSKDTWESIREQYLEMFQHIDTTMEIELRRALGPAVAPSFIIIGAQKCGTTSLYDYISQHPNAIRGKKREPHFFDWKWNAAVEYSIDKHQRDECEKVLQSYSLSSLTCSTANEMRCKYLLSLGYSTLGSLVYPTVFGESTPSYLLYGKPIAQRVYDLYPSMRLIVLLRNPIERAYSHFCMTADKDGTPSQMQSRKVVQGKSFEDVINEDLNLLRGISAESDAEKFQQYANKLPLTHGCHAYIGRGLYAFQLELWFSVFPRRQILVLNLDSMKTSEGICNVSNQAYAFLGLKDYKIPDSERKNTRSYPPLDTATYERLTQYYAPFNERLEKLIGQKLW